MIFDLLTTANQNSDYRQPTKWIMWSPPSSSIKKKPSKSSSSSFGRIQALLEFTGLATKILAKLEAKIQ